jgi:hypothetical protein
MADFSECDCRMLHRKHLCYIPIYFGMSTSSAKSNCGMVMTSCKGMDEYHSLDFERRPLTTVSCMDDRFWGGLLVNMDPRDEWQGKLRASNNTKWARNLKYNEPSNTWRWTHHAVIIAVMPNIKVGRCFVQAVGKNSYCRNSTKYSVVARKCTKLAGPEHARVPCWARNDRLPKNVW